MLNRDTNNIQKAIRLQPDCVNAVNAEYANRTPLMFAAEDGDPHMIKLLESGGADTEARDDVCAGTRSG